MSSIRRRSARDDGRLRVGGPGLPGLPGSRVPVIVAQSVLRPEPRRRIPAAPPSPPPSPSPVPPRAAKVPGRCRAAGQRTERRRPRQQFQSECYIIDLYNHLL